MDEVKPAARLPTVEHREPCDSRGSRTVLGAPGGEIPPGDSSLTTDRIFSADGRFGCEADMAGPAADSTRSLVTQGGHERSRRHRCASHLRRHRRPALFVVIAVGRIERSPNPGTTVRLRLRRSFGGRIFLI